MRSSGRQRTTSPSSQRSVCLLDRVVDRHAPQRVAGEVLGDVPALGHVPGHGQRRPAIARARSRWPRGRGCAGPRSSSRPFTRGRSTDRSPAAVSSSGTSTGGFDLVVIDDDIEHDDDHDDPDEQDRRDLAGPAVLGGRRPLIAHCRRTGKQASVHEPGDEDGATDKAEEVAGGAEEERARWGSSVRARRPGWGHRPGPTREEEGRTSVHLPGLRGCYSGVKRGVVRVFGKPYRCVEARARPRPRFGTRCRRQVARADEARPGAGRASLGAGRGATGPSSWRP